LLIFHQSDKAQLRHPIAQGRLVGARMPAEPKDMLPFHHKERLHNTSWQYAHNFLK
jgi:hypothetical protein